MIYVNEMPSYIFGVNVKLVVFFFLQKYYLLICTKQISLVLC